MLASRFLVLCILGCGCGTPLPNSSIEETQIVRTAAPGAVNLYRDLWGMPHIYAEREEDGFFGLGYAAGEDRLVGVLLGYLAVRGELAASFGSGPLRAGTTRIAPSVPNTVESDRFALRGRYLEEARANFRSLSGQTQANLRAYVAGLSLYMEENPGDVPEWAPPLEPALPTAYYAMLVHAEGQRACDGMLASKDPPNAVGAGSNAWAISPARTASGATLFSSDSHGQIELFGTFFHSWRLKAGALDLFAVDLTGTAVLMKGHSPHFAWAWTEGRRHVADCYAVRTMGDNSRRYVYDGEIMLMEVRPYVIEVRGDEPALGAFEYTFHNGVLSPVVARSDEVAYVSSSAYTGRTGYAHDQLRALAMARDRPELEAALSGQDLYPANLLIGGADGTILYMQPGRIPVRSPGWRPDVPLDGNTSASAWTGLHSYSAKVKLINPKEGYVTNENVSPDLMYPQPKLRAAEYPAWFGFDPNSINSRQQRALELLNASEPLTHDRAVAALFDDVAPASMRWNGAFAALAVTLPAGSEVREFVELASRFDGRFTPESRAALYHSEIRAALGSQKDRQVSPSSVIAEAPSMSGPEAKVLLQAAQVALQRLQSAFGHSDLSFGDVFVTGRGKVRAPGLGLSFRGGDSALIAGSYELEGDGVRRQVGGTRNPFLVSFTVPLESWSLTLYGASDDPHSSHYSDQAPLLARRELKSNYFSADELSKALKSTRTIDTASNKSNVRWPPQPGVAREAGASVPASLYPY